MSMRSRIRRGAFVGVAAAGAVVLGAAPAMAHHCYVPMYSLGGPTSANWLVFSAEDGAAIVAGYEAGCDEAVDAGYAALRAAGMPVGIKIFEKMTIGHPKESGGSQNPNGANGVGLEYFGAGSTLADDMVMTWIEGAESVDC
ncbi:hypothetical protein ACK8HX_14385 [Oryzobacter sp. R7]|uniref:hypothetical protein n=1 Tax=Oryzobacter faecalis TaxID=3388656 RepID=UPI00398CCE53